MHVGQGANNTFTYKCVQIFSEWKEVMENEYYEDNMEGLPSYYNAVITHSTCEICHISNHVVTSTQLTLGLQGVYNM